MESKKLEIFYIENAVSQDAFANLSSDLDKEVWSYGVPEPTYGWGVEDTKNMWWCDLIKNRWHEVVYQNIIDKLETIDPNIKNYIFKIINAQAGGRTFGLDGSIHIDHDFKFNNDGDGFMTFCWFPNKEWEPEWGGELQFFDENGNIIASYLPMPNTCIVFDSNIPHRGLAPTRDCDKLRKYVSIKVQVHKMWNTTTSVEFKDIQRLSNGDISEQQG